MAELINGRQYRLPNGETVTAKQIGNEFLLEYRRKSRAPLSVGSGGKLMLRGEQTGLSIDSLVPEKTEEEQNQMKELKEVLDMVFEIREYGGEMWEALQGAVRSLHASVIVKRKPE